MTARILDGRAVSRSLMEELRGYVSSMAVPPKLVFVRAGDDPASESYVRSKGRLAAKAGVRNETIVLESDTNQTRLREVVNSVNEDDDVDGILVQLPLYDHLEASKILASIDPSKDVDGLHPVNVGRLWSGEAGLVPATPGGLIRILDHYELPIEGKSVVIVGRSNLVGKPAAALFLARNATVTVAHSRTRNLAEVCRGADILVAAAGQPGMIRRDMVKAGAVVLDVGQAPVDGVLMGDVAPEVFEVAGAVTPTPGGTGPMTVAMVVANTVTAAEARRA